MQVATFGKRAGKVSGLTGASVTLEHAHLYLVQHDRTATSAVQQYIRETRDRREISAAQLLEWEREGYELAWAGDAAQDIVHGIARVEQESSSLASQSNNRVSEVLLARKNVYTSTRGSIGILASLLLGFGASFFLVYLIGLSVTSEFFYIVGIPAGLLASGLIWIVIRRFLYVGFIDNGISDIRRQYDLHFAAIQADVEIIQEKVEIESLRQQRDVKGLISFIARNPIMSRDAALVAASFGAEAIPTALAAAKDEAATSRAAGMVLALVGDAAWPEVARLATPGNADDQLASIGALQYFAHYQDSAEARALLHTMGFLGESGEVMARARNAEIWLDESAALRANA